MLIFLIDFVVIFAGVMGVGGGSGWMVFVLFFGGGVVI